MMKLNIVPKTFLVFIFGVALLAATAGQTLAQGQSEGKGNSKKELKATNKEANNLAA